MQSLFFRTRTAGYGSGVWSRYLKLRRTSAEHGSRSLVALNADNQPYLDLGMMVELLVGGGASLAFEAGGWVRCAVWFPVRVPLCGWGFKLLCVGQFARLSESSGSHRCCTLFGGVVGTSCGFSQDFSRGKQIFTVWLQPETIIITHFTGAICIAVRGSFVGFFIRQCVTTVTKTHHFTLCCARLEHFNGDCEKRDPGESQNV